MSTATLSPSDRPETETFDDEVVGLGLERRSVVVDDVPAAGAECPNCSSTQPWGSAMWCPVCGYYPALNRAAVDIASERAPDGVEQDDEARPAWQQIPAWVWVLAGGFVAVTAISFALKFLLAESPYRSLWSWVQFAAGLTGVLIGHITAYLHACSNNDRISPFDIWMKPFAIWGPTLHSLPKQSRRLYLATWGLAASLMAVYVVGGVEFKNPLDLIEVEQAKKEEETAKRGGGGAGSDQSMEEAMNEFADEAGAPAGVGEEDGEDVASGDDAEEDDGEEENEISTIDCLIVGYTNRGVNDFATLLLAAELEGKLRYVGTLTARRVPDRDRLLLVERMRPLERYRPAVEAPYDATWLKPELSIQLTYHGMTPNKRLIEPEFQQLIEPEVDEAQAGGDTAGEPAGETGTKKQTADPRGGRPAPSDDRRAAAKPAVQ